MKVCNRITFDSGGFQTPNKLPVNLFVTSPLLFTSSFHLFFLDANGMASSSPPSTLFDRKKPGDGETLLSVDRSRQEDVYGCLNKLMLLQCSKRNLQSSCMSNSMAPELSSWSPNHQPEKILTHRCYSCGLIFDASVQVVLFKHLY